MDENKLYYGDNLDIMRRYIKDESIDLIYLDPPWNKKRQFNMLFREKNGSQAASQIKAFEDIWHWDIVSSESYEDVVENGPENVSLILQGFRTFLGTCDMLAYLSMMAQRLVELRRVLKPIGSIYFHCDPTASHYIKLLMDAVFGYKNFRNEIIWHYGGRGAKAIARQFARNHDVILFYSKDIKNRKFLRQYKERKYTQAEARSRGFRQDENGRWFKTAPRGDYTDDSIARLDLDGRIHRTRSGKIRIKYFLDAGGQLVYESVLIGDTWNDIADAMHMGSERLGYPTQKPIALLERIIKASSDEDDVILDPFCGCGTTVDAAQRLNRSWIGIDIAYLAISVIEKRLKDIYGDDVEYELIGEPISVSDARALAKHDRFHFQTWALGIVGARPSDPKKGADRGIDGRKFFIDGVDGQTKQIILSVKSGKSKIIHVRELWEVTEREQAEIGVLIAMEKSTRTMKSEAAAAGFYHSPLETKHPKLQILTIEELLSGKEIDYPRTRADVTYKKAQRFKDQEPDQLEIFNEGA